MNGKVSVMKEQKYRYVISGVPNNNVRTGYETRGFMNAPDSLKFPWPSVVTRNSTDCWKKIDSNRVIMNGENRL